MSRTFRSRLAGRRQRADGQRGQALVLFVIVLVVILAFAAIVVDLGVLRNDRQILANAVDAGALAGGTKLPVDGNAEEIAANALIDRTVQADRPGITTSDYTITYKCLIGVDAGGAPAIVRDIPMVCDPTHSLGRPALARDFIGAGPTRVSSCDPSVGDKCNVVVVAGSTWTQYGFGPVVGVNQGNTGVVSAAACQGPCGDNPVGPVDVMLVMDRTQSMSGVDTTNAVSAANAIRTGYDPAIQWLGLGLLGPSQTGLSGSCKITPATSIGTANLPTDLRRWVPLTLSGIGAPNNQDYTQSGSLLAANMQTPCYANSSTGTDLKDPWAMAAYELQQNGRAGVRKGIIFETDGQPNTAVTTSTTYCADAVAAAQTVKNAGIEVFTIGFGLDGANDAACPDTSGAFKGKTASFALASMATQPSTNSLGCPGAGATNTNNDGDHFFCLPKTAGASANLASVFKTAAAQLARTGAKLIDLYPTPVVDSVNPSAASASGGATVTISGQYFTGATDVTFGGIRASFTVVNDTTITATAPAGTAGVTVDVIVTTPSGSSVTTSSSDFRYT